jgi:ADP-ribosyl-[dinitrogen reductase] hydrolase
MTELKTKRIWRALEGYVLGDCLGAPYEFDRAERVERTFSWTFGESVFGHAPGRGTDDTELVLASGLSLATNGGFDRDAWMKALSAWLDGDPKDVGSSTRQGIAAWRRGQRASTENAGNGALILATSAALSEYGNPLRASVLAGEAAGCTHPQPQAVRAASYYGWLLGGGARTASGERLLEEAWDVGGIGWAPRTLKHAVDALGRVERGEETPADALRSVVVLGGDTDTNAAIAGALIGARMPEYETWPTQLVEQLDDERATELLALAEALAS